MTPEKLFHELLGLDMNWEVVGCDHDRTQPKITLEIREPASLWQIERCPKDGGPACAAFGAAGRRVRCYDHTELLRWRHLNVFGDQCEIVCRLPRACCRQCGHLYRVTPPWEKLSKHFSKQFEAFALLLMREMPVAKAAAREQLKDSQWLWRKNPGNLTERQQARMERIDRQNLVTAKAHQMRLNLQAIYELPCAGAARRRFGAWSRWVKREARKHPCLLLAPMVKVAEMIERQLVGIVAYWRHRVTNGWREALNSVLQACLRLPARGACLCVARRQAQGGATHRQAIKGKARGHRTAEYLKAIIYFVPACRARGAGRAGKLRIAAT